MENDFSLYKELSDKSSEIECLFLERAKQLLKKDALAAIITPVSLLSNSGIYTKTREILLKYFQIISIVELGANTFMATKTHTVILFLRRRDDKESQMIKAGVDKLLFAGHDITINGTERPLTKYLKFLWSGVSIKNYMSLWQEEPDESIKKHERYEEYQRNLRGKDQNDFADKIKETEREKFFYFILTSNQRLALINSGSSEKEKSFMGYTFSQRRGNEGIHSFEKGKTIEESTKMFDICNYNNPEKASHYIRSAYMGDIAEEIHPKMQEHVRYINLADRIDFESADFQKSISLRAKNKTETKSQWQRRSLAELVNFQGGLWKSDKEPTTLVKILRSTNFKLNNGKLSYADPLLIKVNEKSLEKRKLLFGDILLEKSGGSPSQAVGRVGLFEREDNDIYSWSNFCARIRVKDKDILNPLYLWLFLDDFYNKSGTLSMQNGLRLLNLNMKEYGKIKVPLPAMEIQKKISKELQKIFENEEKAKEDCKSLQSQWYTLLKEACQIGGENRWISIGEICEIQKGTSITKNLVKKGNIPVIAGGKEPAYFHEKANREGDIITIGASGNAGFVNYFSTPIFASDCLTIKSFDETKVRTKAIYYFLKFMQEKIYNLRKGQVQTHVYARDLTPIKIPLLSIKAQEKILRKTEIIENQIRRLEERIQQIPQQKASLLEKYL